MKYNNSFKYTAEFARKKRKFSDAKTERMKVRTNRPVSDTGTTVEVIRLSNLRVWVLIWGYKRHLRPT